MINSIIVGSLIICLITFGLYFYGLYLEAEQLRLQKEAEKHQEMEAYAGNNSAYYQSSYYTDFVADTFYFVFKMNRDSQNGYSFALGIKVKFNLSNSLYI